ncbi:S8 family serine peptidase [Numidum massiliense]|uniref:S8 family serine peptidase n=1 Tax=Numidum massiliense TaxID=1522315 RepID=UPI0006D57B89|nr:S8 family serine peptidase [Numidum massiliense]
MKESMTKRLGQALCLALAVVMCVALIPLESFAANTSGAQSGEEDLALGQEVEGSMQGQALKVYKVTPKASEVKAKTHMRVTVKAKSTTEIFLFPDKKRLDKGLTYHYKKINAGKTGSYDFPIAWKGPYYVVADSKGSFSVKVSAIKKGPRNIAGSSASGAAQAEGLPADLQQKRLDHKGLTGELSDADKANLVFVKMKDGAKAEGAAKAFVGQKTKSLTKKSVDVATYRDFSGETFIDNLYVVKLNGKAQAKKQVTDVAKQLSALPEVEYAEANRQFEGFANDVNYSYQWPLANKATKGADIKYASLKNALKGKNLRKTKVAVLDTGIEYTASDFSGRVKDGKNYVHNNKDAMDDHSHGTHVSSIIGAKSGNGYSMTGVNDLTTIIPVKVLDRNNRGWASDIAKGIKYATDKGAKVINLSLGTSGKSQVVEDALKYANKKKVTVVAATGNAGKGTIGYPASSTYTIAVGSTNNKDKRSKFSNYGKGLTLVAPGEKIPAMIVNGEVAYLSGTSMATPHVSAVAAYLYSVRDDMTPAKAKSYFQKNSTDLGKKGYDTTYGYGRLHASKVFNAADTIKLKVNTVYHTKTTVTGKAKKGTTVTVKKGKTVLGKGKANSKGTFSVKIKKQKVGTKLTVVAQDAKTKHKSSAYVTVKKGKPAAPTVNTVYSSSKTVKGKTSAKATVTVKRGKTKLGSAKATSKGAFSVKIKPQKAGTKLTVTAKNTKGQVSFARTVTVKKAKPAAPTVNAVYSSSKTVKGKTSAKATVTVKRGKTKLGSAKATSKGAFSVKIKPQKAGTKLTVTAKNTKGQVSFARTVTVKKAKK